MADQRFADQEFVDYVVKSIVDHPDAVKTERTIDEMGVLITLGVHAEDMGKIIGRQGQTAKSLRTLLRVIGAKNDARVNLKILEPEGGKRAKENMPSEQAAMGAMGGALPPIDPNPMGPAPEAEPNPLDDLKI